MRDLPARGSFTWSVAEVLTLIGAIREELAAGCVGLVVTHGTDTMEESAFLTSLVAGPFPHRAAARRCGWPAARYCR